MRFLSKAVSVSNKTLPCLAAALFLAASLGACTSSPSPLPDQLSAEFQPGLSLDDARKKLAAHGTTFSEKTASECQTLVERSPNVSQLPPQGGPCLFGKIPLSRSWYGGKSDVILQLVFAADGRLVDGHFEQIDSLL
ncbi:hypothetical protein [Zoogloea sp.]|uniref:hypothetical protein n=1 Tax=Zoogloea sp. TaxID=49181 RepID=UPI0035B30472